MDLSPQAVGALKDLRTKRKVVSIGGNDLVFVNAAGDHKIQVDELEHLHLSAPYAHPSGAKKYG